LLTFEIEEQKENGSEADMAKGQECFPSSNSTSVGETTLEDLNNK
jgi:hypothetical protein